jgi:hypothetical protein
MGWRVYTTHTIHLGAIVCFVETPEAPGEEPALPEAGTALSIVAFASSDIGATVQVASQGELLLRLTDGSQWRLTPWTTQDPKPLIGTRRLQEQNWVVRNHA